MMAGALARSFLVNSAHKHLPLVYVTCNRFYSSPPPRPDIKPDIGFKELKEKLGSRSVYLIDVRLPKELEDLGALPGAVNIPLQRLGVTMLLPTEDFAVRMGVPKPAASAPVVTMCMAGIRAKTAQLALMGMGYNNVRNYKGSFEDWVANGGSLIKADKEDIN